MTDILTHPDASPLPTHIPSVVALHHGHGDPVASTWQIAVEMPVQISINGAPRTVMLATPSALDDLARGLAVSERWVAVPTAIRSVAVSSFLREISVDLTVDPSALLEAAGSARSMAANTGCGLCGIETLAALQSRPDRLRTEQLHVRDFAVRRAFDALASHQPLNAMTRSVHAAAWCSMDGSIRLVREDVGRHNALDKVIGALAADDVLQEPGFVVMTSRCSYELVYKATAANTQLLATISAPTSMAIEWARALDLPLASTMHMQDGTRVLVHFPQRVDAPALSPLPVHGR